MERSYSHIDLDERRKIARWRTAGLTVGVIAEQLGRHRSTIFREIKRNTFVDKVVPDLTDYYCVTAHAMSCERRAKLSKLVRFSHVRQSVIERIIHGWSPQQIAGRMRLERHPVSVSHETIYNFAYRPVGMRSSCGGACQSIALDGDHDMQDASTDNDLAQNSTSCAGRMSLPIANNLAIGNAI